MSETTTVQVVASETTVIATGELGPPGPPGASGEGGGTPATTVTSETAFGLAPVVGTDTDFARGTHSHGSPTDPVPAHAALTTGVHGVGASTVESVAGAQAKADAAQAASIPLTQRAAADGVAALGPDVKIPSAQLPSLAITSVAVVASEAAMLALAAQEGDVARRSDLGRSFMLAASPPTVLANWVPLSDADTGVASVDGDAGPNVVLPSDGAAGTGTKRTLGTGAQQAAAGNDARLSDARVPTDGSVTTAKIVDGAVTAAKVAADVATQQELDAHGHATVPVTTVTTTGYTLVLADAGKVVRMTFAGASTLTVPTNASVAFPTGTIVNAYAAGGALTIAAAAGVTIRNNGTALAQYAEGSLRKDGTDEWVRVG